MSSVRFKCFNQASQWLLAIMILLSFQAITGGNICLPVWQKLLQHKEHENAC